MNEPLSPEVLEQVRECAELCGFKGRDVPSLDMTESRLSISRALVSNGTIIGYQFEVSVHDTDSLALFLRRVYVVLRERGIYEGFIFHWFAMHEDSPDPGRPALAELMRFMKNFVFDLPGQLRAAIEVLR